jgi:hypothetical protein
MGALDDQARRLEVAVAAIVELKPRVEAGAPWSLAELYGPEPEASWGPPELLAHLEEYLPYWLGEIERVLDGPPGAPVPFGRVATDPIRIGVIGRDRTLPLRELFSRIEAGTPRVAARLRELTEAEADRTGLHPARGEMNVRDMLEPFLVGHSEGHVTQLREILVAAGR